MKDEVVKLDINAVSLRQAVLCANCEVISDSPHETCAVCGSHSLLPLARVLGGMPEATDQVAQEVSKERPSVAVGNVLVLTSKSHQARRRRAS